MPTLDLNRAIVDFPYYAASLLKIKTKEAQLAPFVLWEPQIKLDQCINNTIKEGKLPRVICLKARQEGISTYSEGRIFWKSHLNENTRSVVITHEKESGASIFAMCRLFYECLPKALKPMARYDSKKELVFENPDKRTRAANPGLRSSIEVYTAGKKNVARSTFTHNLHSSELASWTFPEDVIPALMPTIPMTQEAFVMFESTAKGVGNFFHDEWLRATEGESNFTPLFIAWFELASYSREFRTQADKKAFNERLTDEEKELKSTFNLTLEQLYWRRLQINDLGGDVDLFRQENPATPSEAFIISGVPVFDRKKLRIMATKCKEPTFRGTVDFNGKLVPTSQGELKIWKWPEKSGIYSLGVDVSDGGKDYCCVEIWQKLKAPLIAEQVAEWHGHTDPVILGEITSVLATLYGEGLVGVETNGPGSLTQNKVLERHWNVYRQENFDRFDVALTKKLGWLTNLRTKKLLVSYMTHCIHDMGLIIHSKDLIRECTSFIRSNLESAGSAAGSGYDDRVMAAMIGLFIMHQTIDEEPNMEFVSTMAPPVDSTTKAVFVDRDFEKILSEPQTGYEDSWLNY